MNKRKLVGKRQCTPKEITARRMPPKKRILSKGDILNRNTTRPREFAPPRESPC